MSTSGPLLDRDEAAACLRVTPRDVRALWQERRLAGVEIGTAVRFRVSDLDAFIQRNAVKAVKR